MAEPFAFTPAVTRAAAGGDPAGQGITPVQRAARVRPRSAARSSRERRLGRCARTSPPNATAATRRARASCSRSRRRGRSGCGCMGAWASRRRRLSRRCGWAKN